MMFKKRNSVEQVEESEDLAPKFDENGLIVVTTVDHQTKEILMTGYMNEESLTKSIETKEAHYYSRSRRPYGIRERKAATFKKSKKF